MEPGNIIKLRPGLRLVNRYELVEQIGAGSMAEVWRGRDDKVGRPVAIKVVSELLAPSEQARRRFSVEVRAIGRIHHINVVSLLGHGTVRDGRPFLVMEYHPGQTLREYLAGEHRIGPYSAVMLGKQLLAGVAAAHDEGIVHRDLKPANILLARLAEGKRQVKILDFGVARVMDLTLGWETQLTQAGTMLGSPRYMPVELARGAGNIDARADVFQIGGVLYHTLAGRPPFDGNSIGEISRKVLQHDIVPLAQLRPDIPTALVQVLERAMAHLPDDRYSSARQMRSALDRLDVAPGR